MVSFLKFAVSTLHVWEKGGNCAFPAALTYEVFSLGTFTLGHDRYCFALADGSSTPGTMDDAFPEGGFRHNIWPLTVMLEMIACAVILGYMWSTYLGDREYLFELHYQSCIGRALTEIRSNPKVEVVRFRAGDRDVVNRALQVFHTIGTLPLMWKFCMDNYQQIPIQALAAMLRGLGQKKQLVKPSSSKRRLLDHPDTKAHQSSAASASASASAATTSRTKSKSANPDGRAHHPSTSSGAGETMTKLQSLELYVEELIGTPSQLDDLCAKLKGDGCSSLRHVKLYFWRHTEREQTIRNERTLVPLLLALKHHPTLQELEIKASMGPVPFQSNSSSNAASKQQQQQQESPPITPVVEALIAVVQTCRNLRRLRLNLWSRQLERSRRGGGGEEQEVAAGDQDTWYVAPLAEAMSQPSLYTTTSSLQSLELLFASPLPKEGSVLVNSLAALERMVRCNYNITHLFVGPTPDDEEYGDAYDYDNMLYHRDREYKYPPNIVRHLNSTRLYVTLNRLGRKRLLSDPDTTRQDWIQAILQDRDNISITFSWISMYPAILPLGSANDMDHGLNAVWTVDTFGGFP